jgi:branched-chain amino acid transport system substrate-binding protein
VPTTFRAALGENNEGIFSAISWFPEAPTFQNGELVSRYVQLYQGTAQDVAEDAANAFTAGQVLEQAVANVGSVDNAALIADMHRSTYQTVVGPLNFDAVGKPRGSYMILQWLGPTYVGVAPENRQQRKPMWPTPARK